MIFAKTVSPSIIPGLVAASPCLLNQLLETFKNLTADQQQKAKDAGWSTDQGQWVYQKWSPANQALEQDTTRAPLQTSILKALTTSEIVTAFHSKRPLTPNMQGAMVVLQLDVNFRKPEANQFYEKLEMLMGQAALQLGGLQIRKEAFLVAGHILFSAIFVGWRSPAQQHDCAEFLTHLIAKIGPGVCDGKWEARRQQVDSEGRPQVVAVDRGTCDQAISLDLPDGDARPAHLLLHNWHTQAYPRALQKVPSLLFLSFPDMVAAPEWSRRTHAV